MNDGHISVLFKESIYCLNLKPGNIVVDGTLGGGGHAKAILERIIPGGLLIGIDKDESAIKRCENRLAYWKNNIEFINDDFKNIKTILYRLNIRSIDAVILDLGVSSYQLDEADRGFSYKQNAKLDMRMDQSNKLTAEYIINRYSQEDLARLIKENAEEKWAARIAGFIVKARQDKPIVSTGELVEIIKKAIPLKARKDGPHPAKRTFQALRIEVNNELEGLEKSIWDYVEHLSPKGRIAIITFHSLEDRIVKNALKKMQNPCECPSDFPVCVCGKKSLGRIVTKKPICPNEKEIEKNPRSRSAKLRIFEKID